ncbi:MAG TPA: hypothetical protein VJG85_00400 [Patescibacteria group bacterium]|nr:hypothetical protein [Patescibacteria group bacterium]
MMVKKDSICAEAIKNTLSYRSIFKYSLSLFQLRTMMISKEEISDDVFINELDGLVKRGGVKSRSKRYYARGYRPVDWNVRAASSKKLIENSRPALKALNTIPWIKLLCITGSVAAYNADKNADIDVFIVCTKNRLWLTRFFTVVMLKVLGKYRSDTEPAGRICPNIYVDEKNIIWPKNKRNLYVAQEITMMHPIINKDNTYFKFIESNDWIFEYFRNFAIDTSVTPHPNLNRQSRLVNIAEDVLRRYQVWYMKKRKTNEITEKHLIHFNREDWTEKILGKYSGLIKKR